MLVKDPVVPERPDHRPRRPRRRARPAQALPRPRYLAISDGGASPDGTVEASRQRDHRRNEELLLLDPRSTAPDKLAMTYIGLSGKGSAFQAIFELAAAVGTGAARCWTPTCARSARPGSTGWSGLCWSTAAAWSRPLYARHKLDGTITNSDRLPADRGLYGRQLRQPISGDFGFSGRLAAHWAGKQVWSTDVARFGVDIWMTTVALCEGFSVCQSVLQGQAP